MSRESVISTSIEALSDEWDARESVVEKTARQIPGVEIFLGKIETNEEALSDLREAVFATRT